MTVGTGLVGLVSAGAGLGFNIKINVPVTLSFPPAQANVEVCPNFVMFAHVYARAGWIRKDHYENLFPPLTECFQPLMMMAAANPITPLPDVLAAPSVAAAADGQVLSAFVQNTAVSGAPQLQIMARFQNSSTGVWQTAVPISNPGHSASTPVVGFAGAGDLPVVVWVATAYSSSVGDTLSDDFSAHLNRQDLFYSWYENGSWQPPVRLTSDLFADGMPSLAGSSSGALLTWVRDTDGDPITRADQRIAVTAFNANTHEFGAITLLTGGATGLNAEPQATFNDSTPYLVWTYDGDAELETAVDRHIAIAHETNDGWVVELPPNLPTAVDSPTIVGGQNGVTIAFLVRKADDAGGAGFIGTNGALWTAREGSGAWHATPLRDSDGAFVYAERPLLAINQTETLLAFRRFGEISSNAGVGQLSLSTAQGTGAFSPPVYLTDEAMQFWQVGLAVNPATQQAVLVHVERPAGHATQGGQSQAIATTEMMAAETAVLSTSDDPVMSVNVTAAADPALDLLQLSGSSVAAGEVVTVTAVLRNAGRNPASTITVKLYSGTPASRSLLGTQVVSGPVLFNQSVGVEFVITAVAGSQNIFAELTTNGENSTATNDTAFATLGTLTMPTMHDVTNSGFTSDALGISWDPAVGEHVNSYRILRGQTATGPFELIGESVQTSFTDTLVAPGQTFCYKVQSYNGAFHLSTFSNVMCGVAGGLFQIYLPLIEK